MPDESRKPDDVEKILHDEKSVEARKKALIEELLKKREVQNNEIDDQLAALGYRGNSSKPKRSHHKKAAKPAAPTSTETRGQRPARNAERPKS